MNTFVFALNAVLPLVLLMVLGYIIKCLKLVPSEFFKHANKLCFKIFLPTMLFLNVYNLESISDIDLKTPLFALCALIVIFFLGLLIALLFVKDNKQKGAVWQCVFRSNYAIMGISLVGLVYGPEGVAVASILSAVLIPMFNIFAVISLSVFRADGKKPEIKKVLLNILKNPLIHGVLLGVLALVIRSIFVKTGITFRLNGDVNFIYKTLSYVGGVTTPLALIVLGGQFEFSTFKSAKLPIIVATVTRLVVVPVLVLIFACAVFGFRGAPVIAFVAAFGSPVAVSSAIMAKEMDADGELAGSLVVTTTVASVVSLTVIIAVIKSLGLI